MYSVIVTEHISPKVAHFRQQFMENCTERQVSFDQRIGSQSHGRVYTYQKEYYKIVITEG